MKDVKALCDQVRQTAYDIHVYHGHKLVVKKFSPEKILSILICIELILVALSGLFGFWLRYDFFHINREQNLPTWFSSIQLFFVTYFAMIVANKESLIEEQEEIIKSQVLWYIIAIGFAFLSLDEFAEIHELIRIPGVIKGWVLVYMPIAFLVACYCGYESLKRRKIYPQLPYVLCGSFLVMGAGAFGAEWAGKYMPNKFFFGISLIVEEFSEMLGVSILIYAVLRYSQELDHKYSQAEPPKH